MPARSRFRCACIVLAAIALLVTGCAESAVDASIERSSAPVLVPGAEWTEDFDFSAPPGSTDLYQLRWNFRPGATDAVTGWQVTLTTEYEAALLADGPGQDLVDEVLRAARSQACDGVDASNGLQLCTYPSEFARDGVNAYLVRPVQGHILVIDYTNPTGSRLDYNDDTAASRYIRSDFTAVALENAIDDYLVYIY